MNKTKLILLSLVSALIFFMVLSYDEGNNLTLNNSLAIKICLSIAFGFFSNILFWKNKTDV